MLFPNLLHPLLSLYPPSLPPSLSPSISLPLSLSLSPSLSLTHALMCFIGAPNPPLNFNLNPDPNELSILTLSWNSPIGTFENVPINYTISISGPRVNRNDTVTSTTYQFMDAEDQTCEEHTFNVFATNPAGRGAVTSMEQTIPICKAALRCLCQYFACFMLSLKSLHCMSKVQ